MRSTPSATRILVPLVTSAAIVAAACGAAAPPGWTFAPMSPGASMAGPTAAPPTAGGPTPGPGGITPFPTADPGASPDLGPLTDAELMAITLGGLVPIPSGAPAASLDAATAESLVRARYPGERTTLEVRRIAMMVNGTLHIGWVVALTPAAGASCTFHPGLLPRAIEGGIVDEATGDVFWTMTCG